MEAVIDSGSEGESLARTTFLVLHIWLLFFVCFDVSHQLQINSKN